MTTYESAKTKMIVANDAINKYNQSMEEFRKLLESTMYYVKTAAWMIDCAIYDDETTDEQIKELFRSYGIMKQIAERMNSANIALGNINSL